MEHWLGSAVMERYIVRALRRSHISLTCDEVTASVVKMLGSEGRLTRVKTFPPPDALWVYYFLQLLGSRGRVEKFACVNGTIRYTLKAYVRVPQYR